MEVLSTLCPDQQDSQKGLQVDFRECQGASIPVAPAWRPGRAVRVSDRLSTWMTLSKLR